MAKDIDKTNVQKPKKERTSVLEYFRGVRTEMK